MKNDFNDPIFEIDCLLNPTEKQALVCLKQGLPHVDVLKVNEIAFLRSYDN